MDNVIGLAAFALFAALWAGFAIAVIGNQGSLDATWSWLRSLPLIAQVAVWLLVMPVAIALWAWESAWPLVVRLVIVGGLGVATLYAFFPRWLIDRS